jgi:hypothetical protein
MTTLTTARPGADTATGASRTMLVAAGMAAGAVTAAVMILTHPWGDRIDSSSDNPLSYDKLAPHRGAAWPAMLVDVLGYGVLFICLAIGLALLVRGRGRHLATVASALLVLGAVLETMGGFAFASVIWFGTGLPEDRSRDFLDFANDHVGRLYGVEAAGFLVLSLGVVVAVASLIRSRAVPVPLALVIGLLTVALFATSGSSAGDVVQAVQLLSLGALAVPLWRRA